VWVWSSGSTLACLTEPRAVFSCRCMSNLCIVEYMCEFICVLVRVCAWLEELRLKQKKIATTSRSLQTCPFFIIVRPSSASLNSIRRRSDPTGRPSGRKPGTTCSASPPITNPNGVSRATCSAYLEETSQWAATTTAEARPSLPSSSYSGPVLDKPTDIWARCFSGPRGSRSTKHTAGACY
jgi:hypothetical protein